MRRSNGGSHLSLPSPIIQPKEPPMSIDLPSKELLAAITASAVTAECADVKHATAAAIEAFTNGEFADENQLDAWFTLQRIKQPKLWSVADPLTSATGCPRRPSTITETLHASIVTKSLEARQRVRSRLDSVLIEKF